MLFSIVLDNVEVIERFASDIINEIYYNARGQCTKVKYENGATTFRITRIRTTL